MQDDPRYDDVVGEVAAFLEERLSAAVAAGVREEQVLLDPGIGFGKTIGTTCCCWPISTASPRWAGRSCSARRASASSAPCWAPSRASASAARWPRPCSASPGARPSCGCTTCGPTSRLCASRRRSSSRVPAADPRRIAPADGRRCARAPWERPSEPARSMEISLAALEAPCHCGVTAEERRVAQTLLLDLRLTPLHVTDYADDDLAGTVDYGGVARLAVATAAEGPTGCWSAWRPRSPTGSGPPTSSPSSTSRCASRRRRSVRRRRRPAPS